MHRGLPGVLIVPSMRLLLNDSPRRTRAQLGRVRPRPHQCSRIHRPSTALLHCCSVRNAPRCLQRAPEGQRGDRSSTGTRGGLSVQGTDTTQHTVVRTPYAAYVLPGLQNAPPLHSQPTTAAALTCEQQVHSPSGLHRAWVRTSPCLFHLVSLDAVVLFPSHWQGPHGPSGPYGPDGTFALQHLHSFPAWLGLLTLAASRVTPSGKLPTCWYPWPPSFFIYSCS